MFEAVVVDANEMYILSCDFFFCMMNRFVEISKFDLGKKSV
jgi:hypothetical protein